MIISRRACRMDRSVWRRSD